MSVEIRDVASIDVADIDPYKDPKKGNYIITGKIDYVCVNNAYKHEIGTTYYDLDNNPIILNSNCRPYAFVGDQSPKKFKGCLAIIENIETGKLYYPKQSNDTTREEKHGYSAANAYNQFVIEFTDFKPSNQTGKKIYANKDGEYFVNDISIGKFLKCRECAGLPVELAKNSKPIDPKTFTINKKTFSLPDKFSVTASDTDLIDKKMTVIIENDRRKNREDKEDQTHHPDSVPSNEDAEKIYKKVATLWNNYENLLYAGYLAPVPDPAISIAFDAQMDKLDGAKLLMPELIASGKLPSVSEDFIKTFFENKIKGYANSPIDIRSLYSDGSAKAIYEQAGADLVHHFYTKNADDYYKTKTIADAIYKTETGRDCIENMIKLVDQVFRHWFDRGPDEFNANTFLKNKLDEKWFAGGSMKDANPYPGFGVSSLAGSDEDKLALFCIGGVQGAKVAVKSFTPIETDKKAGYDVVVILQYLDTFGVSGSDYTKDLGVAEVANLTEYNYRGGVMAQWVLQHQYDYHPFTDYLTYTVKMKKMWNK